MSMEIFYGIMGQGQAYIEAHPFLIGLTALFYFVFPGFVTKIFAKIEDCVNGVKFNLWGINVDFSKFEWDDQVNHFLRDYVITLLGRARTIKESMGKGELSASEAESQLEALTKEVVEDFQKKAPNSLRKYAEQKFGGDKVKAAEWLIRRVKAIVYDVKQGDKKKD